MGNPCETNGDTTETVFRFFERFCSGNEIPYVIIKSSVFSYLLLSRFVLLVMLASRYVSLSAIPAFSAFMLPSGLDQFDPTSQRNPPPGPATQGSSKREEEEVESKEKQDKSSNISLVTPFLTVGGFSVMLHHF